MQSEKKNNTKLEKKKTFRRILVRMVNFGIACFSFLVANVKESFATTSTVQLERKKITIGKILFSKQFFTNLVKNVCAKTIKKPNFGFYFKKASQNKAPIESFVMTSKKKTFFTLCQNNEKNFINLKLVKISDLLKFSSYLWIAVLYWSGLTIVVNSFELIKQILQKYLQEFKRFLKEIEIEKNKKKKIIFRSFCALILFLGILFFFFHLKSIDSFLKESFRKRNRRWYRKKIKNFFRNFPQRIKQTLKNLEMKFLEWFKKWFMEEVPEFQSPKEIPNPNKN